MRNVLSLLVVLSVMLVGVPHVLAEGESTFNAVGEARTEDHSIQEKNHIDLELSKDGFNWRTDWWKYLCIVLGGLLALFLVIRITFMLFRLMVFAVCLVVGGLGSLIVTPYLLPHVNALLPEEVLQKVNPRVVAHSIAFLCCYFIALLIMWIIHKPMKKMKKDVE